MPDTSLISQAWTKMVNDIPVTPEEITFLVSQVANELLCFASSGEQTILQLNEPHELPHGVTIKWEDAPQPDPTIYRAQFRIRIQQHDRDEERAFFAQVRRNRHPSVSNPQDPKSSISWNQKNGSQKQWIRDSLTRQVAGFLAKNKR